MEHYIIAKFHTVPSEALIAEIDTLFRKSVDVPGVRAVRVRPNVTNRPNRYDLMICITLENAQALANWDSCEIHKQWKAVYGDMLEKKAIFDCDED